MVLRKGKAEYCLRQKGAKESEVVLDFSEIRKMGKSSELKFRLQISGKIGRTKPTDRFCVQVAGQLSG